MGEMSEANSTKRRVLLHDFIQTHADELGPWDDDTEVTIKNPLLAEYVIITNWMDPEDGESVLVFSSSENLLRAHRIGLLTVALEDWD